MRKYLSVKEKIALNEFKKALLKKLGKDVLVLKLFGSKARGDFSKDSDIDILLVLKKGSERDKDKVYDLVNDILFKYEVDLSVKIFSQKEYNYFNSIPSVFMQIVQKEGVSL